MLRLSYQCFLFWLLILGAGAASAQVQPRKAPDIRKRIAGPNETPQAMEGFVVSVYAEKLGDIRAMTLNDSDDVFVADAQRGRVLRLRDRGRDGAVDIKSTYLSGFDRPSGLVSFEDTLYIADAAGIWKSSISRGMGGGRQTLLADLSKVKTDPDHRPLAISPNGATLYLGLGALGGLNEAGSAAASIVTINTQTGRAALYAGQTQNPKSIAVSEGGRVFALIETDGEYDYFTQILEGQKDPAKAPLLQLPASRVPTDIVMPWHAAQIQNWPDALKNHALISFGGGVHQIDAVDLADVTFGTSQAGPQTLVTGFGDRRSAWGRPSAMVVDKGKGLLIADSWSGAIWRVVGKPAIIAASQETVSGDDAKIETAPKAEEPLKPTPPEPEDKPIKFTRPMPG